MRARFIASLISASLITGIAVNFEFASATATTHTTVAKKHSVKKSLVKKVIVKKKASKSRRALSPLKAPALKWPLPTKLGFKTTGDVAARVPTIKNLTGVISASPSLATTIKACSKFACGAVQVASASGCTWWEVNSKVWEPLTPATSSQSKIFYGTLRSTAAATKPKEILTLLLVSSQLRRAKVSVGGINITCYHSPKSEKVPSTTYTPLPSPPPTTATVESTESNSALAPATPPAEIALVPAPTR